jgi:hypothetical protein
MSLFSETLKGLMALHDPQLSQAALADSTGISQATICRLLGGREPTLAQIGQLCAIISPERERRVELLLAHLRDVAAAATVAGIDERHFVIASVSTEAAGAKGTLGAELELLAEECARHADIRALVSDLARMSMRHRAELVDTAAAVVPFVAPGGPVNPAEQVLSALKRRAASADRAPAEAARADKASPVQRK